MAREEVASAFLAMALDASAAFRRHFLQLAELPEGEHSLDFEVAVEAGRVDVTLQSPTRVVLIENKIAGGALQDGQLLRYYQVEAARAGQKRVAAVLLSPEGVGSREIASVATSATMLARNQMDHVAAVSWSDLVQYTAGGDEAWLRSGLDAIEAAIGAAATELYPAEGSRARLRAIAEDAANDFRRATNVGLMRWRAKEKETLRLKGLPLTIDVWLQFRCGEGKGAPVLDTPGEAGNWNLMLHTSMKPRGDLSADSSVRRWWKDQLSVGRLQVANDLVLAPVGGGWMGASKAVRGDAPALREALTTMATTMLYAVRRLLETVDAQ
jgi:hypothetical protein